MSFDKLGLRAELLRAIEETGYTKPTPIQAKAIPLIIDGKDIMGGAQTGTGKTAGFTLPLYQRLMATENPGATKRKIRALILAPTRELAAQVNESVRTYGKYLPLKSTVIFGGVKINPQISKLREGVDILVATPGRLLDHANQGTLSLSQVDILVLDEADRMLDMGFINDIKKIMALLPKKKQTLLFSATFSNAIKKLSKDLLHNPALVEVSQRNTTAERISQTIHPVDKSRKRELLSFLIGSKNWKQVLVFTRTKHGANKLTKQLIIDGLTASAIHGNKSQGARNRALSEFKSGKIRVLVATDVAARGLDIDHLPHVVNFELPNIPEDYVHRIGRTGRAGKEGEAISLVCIDEHGYLNDIEKVISAKIPKVMIDGYEPDPSIKAEPIKKSGGGGKRHLAPSKRGGRKPAASGNRRGSEGGNGRPGGSRSSSAKKKPGNRTRRQKSDR